MVAGPGDEMAVGAAGRSRMRASHADRERVIDTLKTAFVNGRLTRDELDARTGRALAARTYADLAALTADIPPAPAAARPARPPTPARRRPLARAAVKSGICLIIMAAAIGAWLIADPEGSGLDHSVAQLMLALAACAMWAALGIMGYAGFATWDERSSRGHLLPRPGQGGQAPEVQRPGQVGHDPALPRDRPDQARADLRPDSSWPGRLHSSGRAGRAPRGIRPVQDAV
jgi:Domain of unknown function (DUF1707)